MTKTLYLDMDGTIANLYGQENWLGRLLKNDASVYDCKTLYNMDDLIVALKKIRAKGYEIGIITWTSKDGSDDFNRKVRKVKIEWLKKNGIKVDDFHCVKYGTPKNKFMSKNDILVDDEIKNVENANKVGKGIKTTGDDLLKILENL